MPDLSDHERASEDRLALERLLALIHRLSRSIVDHAPLPRRDGCDINRGGDRTIPGHVRVQIHRIKAILGKSFHAGGRHDP